MIEVTIFTVVVAHPDAPSVVVLTQKNAAANMFSIPGMPSVPDVANDPAEPSASTSQIPFEPSFEAFDAASVSDPIDLNELSQTNGVVSSKKTDSEPGSAQAAEPEEPLLLPIWIGFSEAEAIMNLLENEPHSRPLTYDLLSNIIGAFGSKVERVVIDRVQGSTFFASICLNRDGRIITIDARPSDSIALALQTKARIFVAKDVMNAAARQFRVKISDGGELLYGSSDEMERFHSFIENVSPEDFKL